MEIHKNTPGTRYPGTIVNFRVPGMHIGVGTYGYRTSAPAGAWVQDKGTLYPGSTLPVIAVFEAQSHCTRYWEIQVYTKTGTGICTNTGTRYPGRYLPEIPGTGTGYTGYRYPGTGTGTQAPDRYLENKISKNTLQVPGRCLSRSG